ncbi:MAG: sensor domain-containing protein [Chloroflexi bacterium]|nr:sensor domain-containing protein [Chloroflexota bacterium]
MFNTIEEYLDALKTEMKDADLALVQDAQADAREHLSTALMVAREAAPEVGEADALKKIIEEYGTPDETASAYREIERRTSPSLKQPVKPRSLLGRIFGVYIDPRTWASLLFMFITFVTGIIYFTWAVTGAALSISFLILIIGIPFAILFLLSVQGLALLEGRLVEALLGVRMPRRPLFAQPGLNWLERLKALVTDKHTWISLLYMVLQMPLGVIYFSVNVTLITFSLTVMAAPIVQLIWNLPVVTIGYGRILLSYPALVLLAVVGLLTLTLTLHLARAAGWLHGKYAKWMLVSE